MDAERIARAFVEARRQGTSLREYPGTRPLALADAYAVQDSALRIWNRPIGGWKVGRINAPDDARLGADRLAGPIFADLIVQAGEEPMRMPVFEDGFAAAEAEFMLRLASPREGAPLPRTDAETRDWIDQIRIGIEIASSPYPQINADGPCTTVSDHGNNMGAILGPEVPRARWHSLDEVQVTLAIGGEVVGTGRTSAMLDGPFGAVRFLLANLRDRGIAPSAGWWISTGAITGVHPVAPGDKARASFGELGIVGASITPL